MSVELYNAARELDMRIAASYVLQPDEGRYVLHGHSVSLYILGICAFFNMPVFQRKLLKASAGLSATEDERLLQFVKKWKLFSFYHDLGYVFELLVGCDGSVQEPQILSSYEDLSKVYFVRMRISQHLQADRRHRNGPKEGKPVPDRQAYPGRDKVV